MSKDNSQNKIADAAAFNIVDSLFPDWAKPYARLARYDRPIGIWLLFWPCVWGYVLGLVLTNAESFDFQPIMLFLIGAVAMRGAGCTYNDIIDRDLDAKVARTRNRPLASGALSLKQAVVFLALQCLLGLLVLLQFSLHTIFIGLLSLVPVLIYPFMKRITWWPQAFLGVSFSWGILLGFVAVTGALTHGVLILFLACVFWIIGYDTIYAFQDKEDDALIGVRSTARKFEKTAKKFVANMYITSISLMVAAFLLLKLPVIAFLGIGFFAVHVLRQVLRLDPENGNACLELFKSNAQAGMFPVLGLLALLLS